MGSISISISMQAKIQIEKMKKMNKEELKEYGKDISERCKKEKIIKIENYKNRMDLK